MATNENIGDEIIRLRLLNVTLMLFFRTLLLLKVKPPIDSRASKEMTEKDKLPKIRKNPLTDNKAGSGIIDLSHGEMETEAAVVQFRASIQSA